MKSTEQIKKEHELSLSAVKIIKNTFGNPLEFVRFILNAQFALELFDDKFRTDDKHDLKLRRKSGYFFLKIMLDATDNWDNEYSFATTLNLIGIDYSDEEFYNLIQRAYAAEIFLMVDSGIPDDIDEEMHNRYWAMSRVTMLLGNDGVENEKLNQSIRQYDNKSINVPAA